MMADTMNQMNDDVLVRCEHVSKKFCRGLKRSLWYGVQDICAEINPLRKNDTALGKGNIPELRKDEFWAVNDISFELKRGECLGLIGHNGAGKSTLLKMLNGLIKPDHGRIIMKGRIGALIELNAGFNPILTGRENVYIYGAILGFTKEEIDSKYEAIVEFAEMADFMEMPFRSYSSGMKVRLGFAVAAQMEPDILIIDEVLAVGDVGFKMKCFNRIFEIAKQTSIILVSHSMSQVRRVVSSAMLMSQGMMEEHGSNVPHVIEKYFDCFDTEKAITAGSGKAILKNIKIYSGQNNSPDESMPTISYLDDLFIELLFSMDADVKKFTIHIAIMDRSSQVIAQCFSRTSGKEFINSGQPMQVKLKIPQIPLGMGVFSINVNFIQNTLENWRGGYLAHYKSIKTFKARGNTASLQAPIQLPGKWEVEF